MHEETISKDRLAYTIDLLVTMVVEEIAENTGRDPKVILNEFINSKTGTALYNASSKLWCTGPSYIVELYNNEKTRGNTMTAQV